MTDFSGLQSIATSTAQNDAGLFELNFRDERYLPFEGVGVISRWRMELSGKWNTNERITEFPQFDFNTITDVILHLRYCAKDGGELLKQAAISNLQAVLADSRTNNLFRLFSLRHEFPTEWHQFQQLTSGNSLQLTIPKERFPFMFQGKDIAISKVEAYAAEQTELIWEQEEPPALSQTNPRYPGWIISVPRDDVRENKDLFLVCRYSI